MLQVQAHGETAQLVCQGDLVRGAECDALQAAIAHLLASDARQIVVQLQYVRKIDCAGLGVLADGARLVREQGKSFALASAPPHVKHLIRMMGLDTILIIRHEAPQTLSRVSAA